MGNSNDRNDLTDDRLPPSGFRGSRFESLYKAEIDRYIELRVSGTAPNIAIRMAFGEIYNDSEIYARVIVLEGGDYFTTSFRSAIINTPVNKIWNANISVNELVSLVRSPYVKDATRLGAIKELNILASITIVDENGKTKKGADLNDFYDAVPPADTKTDETGGDSSTTSVVPPTSV